MRWDGSDWAKYTPLAGQRLEGSEQCGMGLNCCTASGPRGLFTFPLTAVMSTNEGIQVNFYAEGTSTLPTPKKQKIELLQKTGYPVSGKISLKVNMQKPEDMSVRIRIPQWSNETTLMINGELVSDLIPGKYVVLQRVWKADDVIELSLDMRGRVVEHGSLPKSIAIVRGPYRISSRQPAILPWDRIHHNAIY